jgi:hypothetical protein
LTRLEGGVWEIRLPLSVGYHSFSTQLDQGPWGIPPGISRGVSDYGDDVGVILVRAEPE